MSVALVGDIHGDPKPLHRAAALPGVVAVIQLGDFGLSRWDVPWLSVPLYFFEGNHEQWKSLPEGEFEDIVPYAPGCSYVPRGTVLTLAGKRFLCAGGADSVDRAYQEREGYWNVREQWTPADEDKLLAATDVDVILAHSPPNSVIQKHFDPMDLTRYFGLPSTWTSPVAIALDRVWAHHGTPPLYCGHMHRSVTDGPCRLLGIDEVVVV